MTDHEFSHREGDRHWRLVQADDRALSASVPTEPEHPPGSGTRRRVLRLIAVLAMLAVLGSAAWVVYGTGVFAVSTVKVTGTSLLTPEQVREAARVRPGTPLARLDTEAIAERVSVLPPVAAVTVERDWPDTVVIRVSERIPVAVVPVDGGFAVLDGTGVVFHRVTERPRHLPLVEVAKPGPRDQTTRDALVVLDALTDELRAVLVKLVAESPTRITLHLTEQRSVIWGDATESDKKAQVAAALLKRGARTIDVSGVLPGSEPDVVTTR